MTHTHAIVWLDHHEARIIHVSPDEIEKSIVHPANAPRQLQRKRGSVSGSRQPEDPHYYHDVVEALGNTAKILIVGPGHAKLELIKHIHAHDSALVGRVVGVETVDHPGDPQLVAHARTYFRIKDSLRA
ncbi:MAG: translational machinery protein [Thiobacillus sp.]